MNPIGRPSTWERERFIRWLGTATGEPVAEIAVERAGQLADDDDDTFRELQRLRLLVATAQLLESESVRSVERLRSLGAPWAAIGAATGSEGNVAMRRYRPLINE